MIDYDFSDLSDSEMLTAYSELDALEKRCKEAKEQARASLIDRMDAGQPSNVMLDGRIIATATLRRGGTRETFKVKNPLQYAAWLDNEQETIDGKRRATTSVRYPKDEATDQQYIRQLIDRHEGEIPTGVDIVRPRADSISMHYAPGIIDEMFNGELSTTVTRHLLGTRTGKDNQQ